MQSGKLEDRNNSLISIGVAGASIPLSAICGALVSVSLSVEQYPKGDPLEVRDFVHWLGINLATIWPVAITAFILSYFSFLAFIAIANKESWLNLSKSKFIQDFYSKIHTGEINLHTASVEYRKNIEENLDSSLEENFIIKKYLKNKQKRAFAEQVIAPFAFLTLAVFIFQILPIGVVLIIFGNTGLINILIYFGSAPSLLPAILLGKTEWENLKEKRKQLALGVEEVERQYKFIRAKLFEAQPIPWQKN